MTEEERRRLRAVYSALGAVLRLHVPREGFGGSAEQPGGSTRHCGECSAVEVGHWVPWPCGTVRRIVGTLDQFGEAEGGSGSENGGVSVCEVDTCPLTGESSLRE